METNQFRLAENQVLKMTDWIKEPTLLNLKTDLEAAKPAHDAQVAKIEHWVNLLNITGSVKVPQRKGRSSVEPKLIRRQAEWRYSALTEPFLSSTKLFKVNPVTFEDEKGAKQNELVLNWQFRTKINRVNFIDNLVRATVDEGTSITRIGWKRNTVIVQETVPVWDYYPLSTPEEAEAFQAALAMRDENPREFDEGTDPSVKEAIKYYDETGEATIAMQKGEQVVDVEKPIENRPTVEVMNPRNFYLDPSCQGDMDKALFALVTFETNKADLLKEGKRYKNLDRVNWQGNSPMSEPDHETKTPQEFNYNDPLRKKVVAHEWWGYFDIHGDDVLHPIVVTWIGDQVIRMEENPYPDGKLPFVIIPYLPVKRDLYGEPDAELLEENQKILGAVTRGWIDLMARSANSQRGHAKGMLDAINQRRFDNGEDYEFNPNIHPNNGMIEHKYPETPQAALLMMQQQNQEAEALTGVKSFSGGMSGEAYGDVAAGIRGVMDAASKREMAILRRLAKGMTEIANKFISMNAEFLSETEVVRVTNSEFVEVKREDLKGNYDLETDISTAEVDNNKAQDLGFILQTIGPNAPMDQTNMILAEICELKRMPVLAHKIRTYKPEPDPMMEQMKQLELQEKQKLVEKLDSEIQLNLAKAEFEKSRKDLTDLDFVEQESGTKHARDIQKQQSQAQGNKELAITNALVKPKKEKEKDGDVEAAAGYTELTRNL